MLKYTDFAGRLATITADIKKTCKAVGRDEREVKLMPVTKNFGAAAVEYAQRAGLGAVGENRVQEAAGKRAAFGEEGMRWELIGPLQRNKVKVALGIFERVQTVDRVALVEAMERQVEALGLGAYPVLIQVNVAEDPAKHGVAEAEAERLAERILAGGKLRLEGLMTIGALSEDEGVVRSTFAGLRQLRERLEGALGIGLPELSMGMSGDYGWAIAEGSTLVRVGTALFGQRDAAG